MDSSSNQADKSDAFLDGIHRLPRTGIDILIVGAGIGGMFMALESWRQGHDVRILEKSPHLAPLGKIPFPN